MIRRMKHGHTYQRDFSPTYVSWCGMKGRVRSNRPSVCKYYKDKGIGYPVEWEEFARFLADMGECQRGQTLDRIDPTGSYSKENCRWVSKAEQQRNKSSTRWIEVAGVRMCLAEASRYYGIEEATLRYRVKSGWKVEDAVSKPPLTRRPRKEAMLDVEQE